MLGKFSNSPSVACLGDQKKREWKPGLHQHWAEFNERRATTIYPNGARPLPLRNSDLGQVLPCITHDRIAQTTCRMLKGVIIRDDDAYGDAWAIC